MNFLSTGILSGLSSKNLMPVPIICNVDWVVDVWREETREWVFGNATTFNRDIWGNTTLLVNVEDATRKYSLGKKIRSATHIQFTHDPNRR